MTELLGNFLWFSFAVLFSAALSGFAWHLVTRHEPRGIRKWSGILLSTLFVVYHPLSWIPAGFVFGLGVGMASKFGTPTENLYLFSITSTLITGAMAWALTHIIKRALKASCGPTLSAA